MQLAKLYKFYSLGFYFVIKHVRRYSIIDPTCLVRFTWGEFLYPSLGDSDLRGLQWGPGLGFLNTYSP